MLIKNDDFEIDFDKKFKNVAISFSKDLGRKKNDSNNANQKVEDGGVKNAEISVSGIIPLDDIELIIQLNNAASSVTAELEVSTFLIADELANALNIRYVVFDSSITFKKHESIQGFSFSLKLTEQQSVAKLAEERKVKNSKEDIDKMLES